MAITTYVAKKLINYGSEKSFAFKLRKKRAEKIKVLIDDCYRKNKKVSIIDIGGTKKYWKIISEDFLLENNVHITIVNLPSSGLPPENNELFTFCYGDGCNLSEFEDNSFHLAHSNSVIEHVGNWENMVNFSSEIRRVAEKFYLQTPNYWFPIEPHFVTPFYHWLPKELRIKLISHFDLGWFEKANSYNEAKEKVESCNLLSKNELSRLFPRCQFYGERIGFLIKSYMVISDIDINHPGG